MSSFNRLNRLGVCHIGILTLCIEAVVQSCITVLLLLLLQNLYSAQIQASSSQRRWARVRGAVTWWSGSSEIQA